MGAHISDYLSAKEERKEHEKSWEAAIKRLPSPKTVFPGYYENESLFLENKAKLLEFGNHISTACGLILEGFEVPFVSPSLDFLLNLFSVENALLAVQIEQQVVTYLNTFVRSKVQVVENIHRLLQATDLTGSEKFGYIINGISGCQEIINLFRDKESHLFINPLASAPVLVNIVPAYVALLIQNYAETKSQTVRVDLVDQLKTLKHTVDDHMSRAMAERLQHIKIELPQIGFKVLSSYMCCDYLFPERLLVHYEAFLKDPLQNAAVMKIVSAYRDRVRDAYDNYFQTATSSICNALKSLENLK